ncbi:LOW QUALITY PROTEIN: olfactory receptor 1E16-like [Gastrophryne carolinensis]
MTQPELNPCDLRILAKTKRVRDLFLFSLLILYSVEEQALRRLSLNSRCVSAKEEANSWAADQKKLMDKKSNATSGFILLGFSDLHYNRYAVFSIILIVYMLTWMGNALLMISIYISPQSHTPMYFFLGNLSVVDISLSTVTAPRLLSSILHGLTTISFFCCFMQIFFFFFFGFGEIYLLAIMAFDRYLAICNPLRYTSIMDKKVKVTVIVICWLASFAHGFLCSYTLSQASYCEDRLVHHYFCDFAPLIKLACAGSTLQTNTGRGKAFSSCSSHLTVVGLFYATDIAVYFRPSSHLASRYDRVVSLGYTILTPMMNSFIYSLRNQEVRKTLKKSLCKGLTKRQ